jgi:hypothetical protein
MEEFRSDGIALTGFAERPTYSGQENTCFCHASVLPDGTITEYFELD